MFYFVQALPELGANTSLRLVETPHTTKIIVPQNMAAQILSSTLKLVNPFAKETNVSDFNVSKPHTPKKIGL
jgi:hypothetical protein